MLYKSFLTKPKSVIVALGCGLDGFFGELYRQLSVDGVGGAAFGATEKGVEVELDCLIV